MTPLTTLKARVDEAEQGGRELDALVLKALAPGCIIGFYIEGDTEPTVFHAEPLARQKSELAHYTTSVDAALALIEAKLPDSIWIVQRATARGARASIETLSGFVDRILITDEGRAKTPALALCSALLAALIAKEQA